MTSPNQPAGAGLWPAHVPRPQPASAPIPGPAPTAPRGIVATSLQEIALARMPWRGVQWTVCYVGLLGYILAITTYRLPIGDISMVVALIGLAVQRERLRVPGVLIGLGLFLAWSAVGYTLTDEPQVVYLRLQTVGKLWLIALVASNALRTREQIRFFVVFWLGCFAFYPIRGAIFNYYIYGETLFGRAKWNYVFSNPNDLAAYCILQLAMALGFLGLEGRGPVRRATLLGLAVIPLVILLTRSRGAFLGSTGFILMVVLGNRKRGKAIVVTAFLAALVIAIAPPDVLDRVRGLQAVQGGTENLEQVDQEGSAFQRFEIWKVARTIIAEHPVVGVGLGAYPSYHARYALRPQFNPTAQGQRDTHSTYLNLAAETGIVGALIWIMSYIAALVNIDRVRRRAKPLLPRTAQTLFICEAGSIGFFTAGLFGSMAHVSFPLLHVCLTWALAEAVKQELVTLKKGTVPPNLIPAVRVTARPASV
jgi:putative inorganic carbon (hco3(-)) transporter